MAKIAFLYPSQESLGVEYLSANLKQNGHEVKLFWTPNLFDNPFVKSKMGRYFNIDLLLIHDITSFNPDMLCFSVVTDTYQWALGFSKRIKAIKKDCYIVFGGIHTTSVPEKVLLNDEINCICINEGDEAIVEIANDIVKIKKENFSQIKNIWFKTQKKEIMKNPIRENISCLDKLPFPDKEIFYEKNPSFARNGYNIIASRGCPFSCTYCCNNYLKRIQSGKPSNFRSPKNIIQELLYAKDRYRIKYIKFRDETFTSNLPFLEEFKKDYTKKIDLPFDCATNPNTVNEKTISILKEMNCKVINIGIQSINQNTRKNILKRQESNKKIEEVINAIKKNRIGLIIDQIIGIPTETETEQLEAAKFYNEKRPDLIGIFWLTYYPKTEITDYAKKHGIITDTEIENIENGILSSDTQGGSVKNIENFIPYQYLFGFIPILPRFIINIIIKTNFFKKFKKPSILFSNFIPRFLYSLFRFNFYIFNPLIYLRYYFFSIKYVLNYRKQKNI